MVNVEECGGLKCVGKAEKVELCNLELCPCSWSAWGQWQDWADSFSIIEARSVM